MNSFDVFIILFTIAVNTIFIQGIKRVEILKRTTRLTWRLKNVELRIGSFDETSRGLARFTRNPLVGFYLGGNYETRATFDLSKGASGRYLTFQVVSDTFLEINEVYLYGEK